MKRLITAVCILIALVTICIVSGLTTKHITKDILSMLSVAEKDSAYQTTEYAKKINDKWERKQKILMIYSNHDELENIATSISILAKHLECGEYNKFKTECKNAQNAIKHFEHSEKIRWENVL